MDGTQRPGVTPEQTQRLKDALGRWLTSESELRAVVLDAVDAGASVAEVATVTGIREETIEQWTGLAGDGSSPRPAANSFAAHAQPAVNADGEVDQLAERRSIRGGGMQAVEAAEAKSRRRDPEGP